MNLTRQQIELLIAKNISIEDKIIDTRSLCPKGVFSRNFYSILKEWVNNDIIEYGTSLNFVWLTNKGKQYINYLRK
jgi:hypothetical protein